MLSLIIALALSTVHATDLSAALAQSDADRADAVAAVQASLATAEVHVHAPLVIQPDGTTVAKR